MTKMSQNSISLQVSDEWIEQMFYGLALWWRWWFTSKTEFNEAAVYRDYSKKEHSSHNTANLSFASESGSSSVCFFVPQNEWLMWILPVPALSFAVSESTPETLSHPWSHWEQSLLTRTSGLKCNLEQLSITLHKLYSWCLGLVFFKNHISWESGKSLAR